MPIKVKKSINVPQYYKDFIEENKIKRERARITVDELTATIASKRSAIVPDVDKFKYPVIDYPEFQQNKYINGRLENAAKGMFEDETPFTDYMATLAGLDVWEQFYSSQKLKRRFATNWVNMKSAWQPSNMAAHVANTFPFQVASSFLWFRDAR